MTDYLTPVSALDEIAHEKKWDLDKQIEICLEYIQNQNDDAAFIDFLVRKSEEE